MFPQLNSSHSGFQLFKSEMTSSMNCSPPFPTGLVLSADHSLIGDSHCPQSPIMFMYETDNNAGSGLSQSPSAGILTSQYPDYDAISPSVEGLTFDTCDFLSYVYTDGGGGGGVDGGGGRGDNSNYSIMSSVGKSTVKELKITDNGPTLTQLNTDNLGTNFFDDFEGLSDFGTDQVEFMKPVGGNPEAVIYAGCSVITPVLPAVPPSLNGPLFVIHASQQSSTLSATATSATLPPCQTTATVIGKRSLSPEPISRVSMFAAALAGRTTNLNWNWEEIESFLQSEDQKMAAAEKCTDIEQPAKKIKTEPICSSTEVASGTASMKIETQTKVYMAKEEDVDDYEDDEDDADSCFSDNDLIYQDADDDNDDGDQLSFLLDSVSANRKEKTYFWQYNTQSKGPKGKRLCRAVQDDDPYVLHDFEDPVFDAELQAYASPRYRHNGKARRGDGNDATPNPVKLFSIGKELKKLGQLINAMTPSAEMSASVRARTLREKNKYASRVCRLKKKAQHEANKIKLHGLEHEHRQLAKVLTTIRRQLIQRVAKPLNSDGEKLSAKLDTQIQTHLTVMTAGHTTEYVNSVLAKVAGGDRSGGLVYDEC